jgi:hypothetical protein
MRTVMKVTAMLLLLAFGAARPGCAAEAPGHAGHNHVAAGHHHPTTGPRGGALLELGREEFHAELLLDEEHDQITICLLDSSAAKPVTSEVPFLRINVKASNKPRQYKLTPIYAAGREPSGATDCYAIVSPQLMRDLHTKGHVAKLSVMIGRKSYSAKLEHEAHEHNHVTLDHAGHVQR